MQPASDKTEEFKLYGQLVPFKAGDEWRGNRNGRPKGSRNRISESFMSDLADLWEIHGPVILLAAAQRDPLKFTEAVASLIPKTFQVDVGTSANSHEEALRALR